MANRLKQEKSPYLMQHGENPVDWYPWCEEAFQKAVTEDKPIFLSIGYPTCHWCNVMAQGSIYYLCGNGACKAPVSDFSQLHL